jgi:Predicted acetyltransferase involved in intracellular survival and related acetyltransferases
MSEIRLLNEADLDGYIRVLGNAYPDFMNANPSPSDYEAYKKRLYNTIYEEPNIHIYGLFRDNELNGLMQLYDFTMNYDGTDVGMGGVGMVAVDFYHKKAKVAKELIEFYLRYYREREVPFAALYPFRPDFYKQMGFGYGTKMNQYNLLPAALPSKGNRKAVRPLQSSEKEQIAECYMRAYAKNHGLFAKVAKDFNRIFENSAFRVLGYERDGELRGFSVFQFLSDPATRTNDLEIYEFVYEDRDALAALLAFYNSQADQIKRIRFNSQDPHFHHLLSDISDGGNMVVRPIAHQSNRAGVAVMYRVIDTAGAFEALSEHNFGNQNLTVKFAIRDTFLPENAVPVTVRFSDGKPSVLGSDAAYDCEVSLDIAEFSSLFMGVVPFTMLHLYGLAEISDESQIAAVDALFRTSQPPICMSRF